MAFEGEEQGTGSEGEAARPAGGDQEDADPPVVRESVELAGYLWPTPGEGATLAARATATVYVGLFR